MDEKTLKVTGPGFETMGEYLGSNKNGMTDFHLSEEVAAEVEAAEKLTGEDKIALYNERAKELRLMSGDIRKLAKKQDGADDEIYVPSIGRLKFEFKGRKKAGKDSTDDEVSLRMSRILPRGRSAGSALVMLSRISRGEMRLIKNNSGKLDLKKWSKERPPRAGHFSALLDARETVKALHTELGLSKRRKQPKSKAIK